jgi:tetratricopeptide (TPR) repeat protein
MEIIVIWNGHTCLPRENVIRCKEWADEAIKDAADNDAKAVILWIQGCMLKELGEYDEAENVLKTAGSIKVEYETLVAPFARYERGVVAWLQGNQELAHKHWNRAQHESSNYNFEYR